MRNITKDKYFQTQIENIQIVTPSIELYHYKNPKPKKKYNSFQAAMEAIQKSQEGSTQDYEKRIALKNETKLFLKSLLNKQDHVELALMSEDYLTVNKVTESLFYNKYKNPKQQWEAPSELIAGEKPYSLLVSVTGRHGGINSGVLYTVLIDNANQVIKRSERQDFKFSPLNKEKMNKLLEKEVRKMLL